MSEWGCQWASILAWALVLVVLDKAWVIRNTDSLQVTPVSISPEAQVSIQAWDLVPGVPELWAQVKAWVIPSTDRVRVIQVSISSLQEVQASLRGCLSLQAPALSSLLVWPCQAQDQEQLLILPRVVTGHP